MNKNLYLIFFLHLFIVVSCTEDNKTSSVICPTNSTSNTQLTANSIQVTVYSGDTDLPFEGAVIQLDNSGPCLLTDKNGFARFDGLSSDKHDVHLFGSPGYGWMSEYYVDATSGDEFNFYMDTIKFQQRPEATNLSFVNLGGSISNVAQDSRIRLSYVSDIRRLFRQSNITTNNSISYDYTIGFEKALNTSVNNEFWIFESARNTNGDYSLVDALLVPKFLVTTTIETGTINTNNIILQPLLGKPTQAMLVGINSVTFPVGFTFYDLNIWGTFKSVDFANSNHSVSLFSRYNSSINPTTITPNTTLEAYTAPFNFENLDFSVAAESGDFNQRNWSYWSYYTNKYSVGDNNIIISPKLSSVPLIPQGQRGRIISWDTVGNIIENQSLYINNYKDNPAAWRIRVNGNSNSITLPVPPNGHSPMLVSGIIYDLSYSGSYFSSEMTVDNKFIYEGEYFSNYAQWVR